jgi:hypothetical protein
VWLVLVAGVLPVHLFPLLKGYVMTIQELAALTEQAMIEAGYDALFEVAVA